MLYGVLHMAPANSFDDYLHMYESTAAEATYRFCKTVNVVFGPKYLREPNAQDTARLVALGEAGASIAYIGSKRIVHSLGRDV